APPSPDYVPSPEHPPSPDYVPGPEELEQAPLSPNYIPEPEYPKYLVPSDDEVPIKDQPLPADVSPTALSPGYVADSDPSEEDPKEDPEEDPIEYPADGRDDDDDDNDYDYEDNDEEDKEEEERLALADSTILPAIDHVPLAKDTKAFETDESAPTPPIPSPPLPLPSPPTHTRPTYVDALLGYRTMIRSRVASPSTHYLSEIPSPPLFVVEESSAAAAARQPRLDVATIDATPGRLMSKEVVYGIIDVWDDMVGDMDGRAPTTLEELSQRVTDLVATLARDTHEMYVRFEDAQDDQALQRD
ncbi:hypothetical protein Tco_1077106, partial [Tanacetum coccineum]